MTQTNSPFDLFSDWFKQAQESEDSYANAFSLATSTKRGEPSCRTVLLKHHDEKSFTFFTNYNSQKGQELLNNPKASMLFYWKTLKKQIRIRGEFYKTSSEISDNYWNTRPYESCLNSYVSHQSDEMLLTKSEINNLMKTTRRDHPNRIPRPENWGGFVMHPVYFEFWSERDYRWHDRLVYSWSEDTKTWSTKTLYP